MGVVPVVLAEVERHLIRRRLHKPPHRHVALVVPVLLIAARPDQRLEERAIEVDSVPAAQEDAFGAVTRRDKTFGEGKINVRRAKIGARGVGVQLVARRVAHLDRLRLAPVQEIVGARGGDEAPVGGDFAALRAAEVTHVLLLELVPESHVLRIEGALGNDRLVRQQPKTHPIGRRERARRHSGYALVLLVIGHAGTRVLEDRKVLTQALFSESLARRWHPDDVVVFRFVELEQAQRRPRPVDGRMELQLNAVHRCDQVMVDEQLQAFADVRDGLIGR